MNRVMENKYFLLAFYYLPIALQEFDWVITREQPGTSTPGGECSISFPKEKKVVCRSAAYPREGEGRKGEFLNFKLVLVSISIVPTASRAQRSPR